METTLFCVKGLPGSGKSTWALDFINANGEQAIVRVEKDLIRTAYFPEYKQKNEREVVRIRDEQIIKNLKAGRSVISSDTNLNPVHLKRLEQIAKEFNVKFEIVDLTAVPYWECIRRDAKRDKPVGEKVISQMYFKWIKPELPKQPQDKPKAIICDLDGTVAWLNGRNAVTEQHLCEQDLVNPAIQHIIRSSGLRCFFTSGRSAKYREETMRWLNKHKLLETNDKLLMRPDGDTRADSIVKKELYDNYIKGWYNILFVLDDRSSVVQLWRSLGLTCLQVDYGDF